jgi:hypothetical protein
MRTKSRQRRLLILAGVLAFAGGLFTTLKAQVPESLDRPPHDLNRARRQGDDVSHPIRPSEVPSKVLSVSGL